jgi:hypothetical protein
MPLDLAEKTKDAPASHTSDPICEFYNSHPVTERLPRGAAGVLLNRGHQFHDLILPIDAQQKRMFDAIDGHRMVGEIVDSGSGVVESSHARDFFQQLWRYDQVVFDTSQAQ